MDSNSSEATLKPGESVGKFVISELLSRSASSEVYAAVQQGADRRVALKVLHASDATPAAAQRVRRLQREAEILTQQSHPNVIRVIEFGQHGRRPFLALELVAGRTLAAWLGEKRRRWQEILPPFLQAGRGLAWAHRVGVVHRDFKAENVLISTDGKVKVTDFGVPSHRVEEKSEKAEARTADELDAKLERIAAAADGPSYLAPEQRSGMPPGPAADQYGFCFALNQALEACEEPESLPVKRLQKILARGLAAQPGARFSRMEPLLSALEREFHGPVWKAHPRLVIAAGATSAVLLLLVTVLIVRSTGRAEGTACGDGAVLEPAWAARKAKLTSAWRKVPGAATEANVTALVRAFDTAASEISALQQQTCEHAEDADEDDASPLDVATRLAGATLQTACLEQRAVELGALVDALDQAAPPLDLGVQAARELRGAADCKDPARLMVMPAPPKDAPRRAEVRQIQRQIATARAWRQLHKPEKAQEAVLGAIEKAVKLQEGASLADALFVQAQVALESAPTSEQVNPEALLFDALEAAHAGRHDEVQAAAALELSRLAMETRPDEAERWLRLASAVAGRLPGKERWQGRLALQRARLALARKAPEQAIEHAEEALPLLSAKSVEGMQVRHQLAMALEQTGKSADACRFAHEAASATAPAQATAGRTLTQNASLLARCAVREGRAVEALPVVDALLRTQMQALGQQHLEVGRTLAVLGQLHLEVGKSSDAVQLLRQSLVIYQRALGEEDAEYQETQSQYASALLAVGQRDEAHAAFQRVVTAMEKQGAKGNKLVLPLVGLGKVYLSLGWYQKSVMALQRAVSLSSPKNPRERADAQFALAKALWAMGGDKVRPVRLATDAAELLKAEGPAAQRELEKIVSWIDKRQPVIAVRR